MKNRIGSRSSCRASSLVALAFAAGVTVVPAGTLLVDGGILDVGGGTITATGFELGADAELAGNGIIDAPTVVAGRISPGHDGAPIGVLTFTDTVAFTDAVYRCHVTTHTTLDRIVAAGDVTGTCTIDVMAAGGAIPLWQIVIDGGAGSDFSTVVADPAAAWRLEGTGTVSLVLTSLTGDSNDDGLPDWWEVTHFGARTVAGHDGDADQDGFINLHEYLAGTDPLDPDSLLKLILVRPLEGETELAWLSVPGKQYAIEHRDDFDVDDWQELGSGIAAAGTGDFTVWTNTSASTSRFYRVKLD